MLRQIPASSIITGTTLTLMPTRTWADAGSGMHSHPGILKVRHLKELVDLDLEVQGAKIDPMVPSVGSRVSDSPLI
jgi:hypothetical protein